MKKKIVLLIMLLFPLLVKAEPAYIYLGKNSDESYVIRQGDTTVVYLLTNYNESSSIMESYNAQVYYNPYIFELVKTDNNYIKLQDNWEVTNYESYSSLINISVRNNSKKNSEEQLENGDYSYIIAKLTFRVKDNAVNSKTYIELLSNNTNYIERNNNDLETFNNDIDRFLYYEINTNSTFKLDSHLTSLSITDDNGIVYPNPEFKPGIYEYNVNTTSNILYINGVCSTNNCEVKGNGKVDLTNKTKLTKTITTISSNNDKLNYKINFIKEKEYEGYPVLKKLNVLKYNLLEEFDKDKSTYHLIIPSTEESILIDYESNYDVYISGNENLKVGENIITINVKNDSNETNSYYILVSKTEEEEDTKVPVVEEPPKEEIKETKSTNKRLYLILCMLISVVAIICITILITNDIKQSKEIRK